MDFVYILFRSDVWWDSILVYLTKPEAIQASLNYPTSYVQIFTCLRNTSYSVNDIANVKNTEYVPTYNYFLNGEFY